MADRLQASPADHRTQYGLKPTGEPNRYAVSVVKIVNFHDVVERQHRRPRAEKEEVVTAHPGPRARFRATLWAIGGYPETSPALLGANVRAALLAFGSKTPDNLAAAGQLDVSAEHGPTGRTVGLCLKRSGLRLSRLLASAEHCDIPVGLLEELPDLTQVEWDATLRMAGLILLALDSEPVRQANKVGAAETPHERFRAALWAIGGYPETSPALLGANVRAALLAFGSKTPDNLAAAGQLDVSAEHGPTGRTVGLCLKNYQELLSEVLWLTSGCTIPEQVATAFPGLVQAEWDTVLLVAKMVLVALESASPP
ncbi:hypothetical protein [Nonomuraea cavernae]|uniref:hypothetical protein n=1 Tax=Nonomuraea cavernae TaxID=2045107 RepID=UPI00340BB515